MALDMGGGAATTFDTDFVHILTQLLGEGETVTDDEELQQ